MLAWQIRGTFGIDELQCVDVPEPVAGPGQVVVELRAASLNYRDLATIQGFPGMQAPPALVPFSDGAGVIAAVGEGVTRVRPGDRVAPTFFQRWIDGPVSAEARSLALGGTLDGVLQQRMALGEDGVVRIPDDMSFEAAATLPCAGLTAWRAVAVEAPVGPGDTVLVQGTGGVSIFALQLAKAAGATVISTSSSAEKLAKLKALGADHLINYKETAEWGAAALAATGGRGVDAVVEIGGSGTMPQSIVSCAIGGHISLIGVLAGIAGDVPTALAMSKNVCIQGLTVGSRQDQEDMIAAIDANPFEPVIDSTFPLEGIAAAFAHQMSQKHFGKICLEF
jgi:NADPH:quinone reductase-like Zn-dependent oxidoreductase